MEIFGGDLELKRLDLERPSRLSRLNGGDSRVYVEVVLKLVLIYQPWRDGGLSWPGWQVIYQDKCPTLGIEHCYPSQYLLDPT